MKPGIMALAAALLIAAAHSVHALEAPVLSLADAMRQPPLDGATFSRVWSATLERFPVLVNGPERDGTYLVSIAMKPDGEVARSELVYAATPQEATVLNLSLSSAPASSEGLVTTLPRQGKGTIVVPGRRLSADVIVVYRALPAGWDASRSVERVRTAVLDYHRKLLLPLSGYTYLLTVVLNEAGTIEREKIQLLPADSGGSPGMVRVDARGFAELGLPEEKVGLTGILTVMVPDEFPAPASQPTTGADGILRGLTFPNSRAVMVRYAWPRRPGEPVGGNRPMPVFLSPGNPASPQVDAFNQLNRLARQYFPDGGPTTGNWMLLSSSGEVLRHGHVDLAAGEQLTSTYVERLFPGIRVERSMMMAALGAAPRVAMPPNRAPGSTFTLPSIPANMVNVVILTPDSPLPPRETPQR